TADECEMDSEFVVGERFKVLVQVTSCVGECGEDEHLLVGTTVAIGRRRFYFLGDNALQFGQLAVTGGDYRLGLFEQVLQAGAVVSNGHEPLGQIEMAEVNAS